MPEFITLDELATRWRVDRERVKHWVHRGCCPIPIRLSPRHWIWPLEQIEAFEREKTRVEKPENMQQEQTTT
ncbi:MAG: hypothetical protein WD894_20235 [Pirellulales bacterium]